MSSLINTERDTAGGLQQDLSKTNLTRIDVEVHQGLLYSPGLSSNTVERSHTLLVTEKVKIEEDEEQKLQIMIAD